MKITKICTGCGEEKVLSEYTNASKGKYGKASKCKSCNSKYRELTKKRRAKTNKKYALKNKDKLKKYKKEYRMKNRDIILKKQREYKNSNRIEINEAQRQKRKENVKYRTKSRLNNNFSQQFRRLNIFKNGCLWNYSECNFEKYFNHFKKDPMWSEYCENKEITIDHIIPVSAYDFSNLGDIKKCWQPENLRLIHNIENNKKSDDIDCKLILAHNIMNLLPKSLIK